MWATHDGGQAMFAVGLDGARPTHCPTQPAASTVLSTTQLALAAEPRPKVVQGTGVNVHTVRVGKLTLRGGDAEVSYTSLE